MGNWVVLADALTDVDRLGVRIRDVLTGTVMSVMLVVSVVVTWRQSKSVLAAAGAFLGAAALWFAVMNAIVFRDSIGQTIKPGGGAVPPVTEGRGPGVVRVVDPAAGSGPDGEAQ
ncbi:hypothetical protein OG462_42800 [Streptomyces sp. NBC_01077]|uniref:hypothetical protein n=1 Tax=Streptomyces sp. NBC_01077 TaxID=2903746 RepID=UPI0038691CFD|nr:hypothetical protein OG462_02225 [Streptomyces sp. NBC_01077]WSV43549.1 hypothetical protein OG462_42800 [Streptomyces sp. NBC_01077]